MAIEGNMRQNQLFIIEINGMDELEIQEFTIPDVELQIITHGAGIGRPDKKTPGKRKVGEATFKKVAPVAGIDSWAWTRLEAASNSGSIAYFENITLKVMNENGSRTIARYQMLNCWVQKIAGQAFKREGDSENLIQEITLAVEDVIKVPEVGA